MAGSQHRSVVQLRRVGAVITVRSPQPHHAVYDLVERFMSGRWLRAGARRRKRVQA